MTLAGTLATHGLLVESATVAPPFGAAALSVTVPVDDCPPATVLGFSVNEASAESPGGGGGGGSVVMFSVADFEIPCQLPLMVIVAAQPVATVVTVKFADVCPAGIVTDEGTPLDQILLVERLIVAPPLGAAAESVTVPVEDCPPATVLGLRVMLLKTVPVGDSPHASSLETGLSPAVLEAVTT